ncbi:hypothetical protein [Luteolibacter soli]|uniref:Uncharacterized protein n=1 Tax=Luteolibacter soli TaxID=3135280 RepID=A0ABU9AWJ8_9BACT
MSHTAQPAAHPPARNARTTVATHIVAAIAMAFLFLTLPARSSPPVPIPPPFLVGNLTAIPVIVQPGTKPNLTWSVKLPASENAADYTFFIRQKQFWSPPVTWDMTDLAPEGESLSALSINPNGAAFELWAVKNGSPPVPYLLDSTACDLNLPITTVTIRTQDTTYAVMPRTRADRPFSVELKISGVISDPGAPERAKGVTLSRHVQSYGATGIGDPLDRTQATLQSQSSITSNGTSTIVINPTEIPGANRAKVRGEERFTIHSVADAQTPASQLDSALVQIWPVADATITGISQGQIISASVPQLTFQLNDLYPSSTTWAHIYKGAPQTGLLGTTIPGSSVVINDSVPANRTIVVTDYSAFLPTDGLYTLELLTKTPFGTDRLARVSFIFQRTGTTITGWRQTHFGTASNTGDTADQNDFDHDGLPNLIEFAFGLDPKQNSAGQLPTPERTGDQITLRFTPPADIAGLLHGVEYSTTLQPGSWSPVPNTGTLPENVFTVSTTGKPRLYLRLTATTP